MFAPQGIRQAFGTHQLAGPHRQRREHHPIPRREHRGIAVDVSGPNRATPGRAIAAVCTEPAKTVNGADNALIPSERPPDTGR